MGKPGSGILPAVIGGVGGLVGGAISAFSKNKQNKRSQKWELEQWHRQNAYNHPQAQMQRLKEAKLNPNSIYGNGATNTGNAQAAGSPQFDAVDGEFVGSAATNTINTYYDTQIKKATINNLERQNDVMLQDIALKDAQTQSIGVGTEQSYLNLENAQLYSADSHKAAIDIKKAQIDSTIKQTQRSQDLHKGNVAVQTQDIIQRETGIKYTQAQIREAVARTKVLKEELKWNQDGMTKNDPLLLRILVKNKDLIIKTLQELYGSSGTWQKQ